jgi:hypothetical protein
MKNLGFRLSLARYSLPKRVGVIGFGVNVTVCLVV